MSHSPGVVGKASACHRLWRWYIRRGLTCFVEARTSDPVAVDSLVVLQGSEMIIQLINQTDKRMPGGYEKSETSNSQPYTWTECSLAPEFLFEFEHTAVQIFVDLAQRSSHLRLAHLPLSRKQSLERFYHLVASSAISRPDISDKTFSSFQAFQAFSRRCLYSRRLRGEKESWLYYVKAQTLNLIRATSRLWVRNWNKVMS